MKFRWIKCPFHGEWARIRHWTVISGCLVRVDSELTLLGVFAERTEPHSVHCTCILRMWLWFENGPPIVVYNKWITYAQCFTIFLFFFTFGTNRLPHSVTHSSYNSSFGYFSIFKHSIFARWFIFTILFPHRHLSILVCPHRIHIYIICTSLLQFIRRWCRRARCWEIL